MSLRGPGPLSDLGAAGRAAGDTGPSFPVDHPRRTGPLRRLGPWRERLTSRGGLTGMTVVLLVALAVTMPVPYVLLSPGPTADTLGALAGEELVEVSGRRTYPTRGRLELTTVSVSGGPGRRPGVLLALRGWLDPTIAVVPEEVVYTPGQDQEQIQQRNAADMTASQQNATAAALRSLGLPVGEQVVVRAVVDGSPADGVLRPGDVVQAVDGQPVSTATDVQQAVRERAVGDPVRVRISRGGQARTETLRTAASPADAAVPAVGVTLGSRFDFPVEVEFHPGDIGGPSAGLMFTLGIVDKLTPGALTGGAHVAGTGTIDPQGAVGAIGGIQQKLVAARERDVDLFLAPRGNCAQVAAATPEGLAVVPVATLEDALAALRALREGTTDELPRC